MIAGGSTQQVWIISHPYVNFELFFDLGFHHPKHSPARVLKHRYSFAGRATKETFSSFSPV